MKDANTLVSSELKEIDRDVTSIKETAPLWQPLHQALEAYPVAVDLKGSFPDVLSRLREALAMDRRVSGSFNTKVYENSLGHVIPGPGARAIAAFEALEKRRVYERTKGVITSEIILDETEFLKITRAKDCIPLLSAAWPFFTHVDNALHERCYPLLSFDDGSLLIHPKAEESIRLHHSRYASPRQSQFYHEAINLLSELIALGEKYGALEALREAIARGASFDLDHDRRWLDLMGGRVPDQDDDQDGGEQTENRTLTGTDEETFQARSVR